MKKQFNIFSINRSAKLRFLLSVCLSLIAAALLILPVYSDADIVAITTVIGAILTYSFLVFLCYIFFYSLFGLITDIFVQLLGD